MPHAAPNSARAEPVMVASEASGRTANVRAAEARAPVPKEPAMMRPSGPVGATAAGELVGVMVRVEMVITVPFRTAVVGLSTGTTVVVLGSARPGHMAGFGPCRDPQAAAIPAGGFSSAKAGHEPGQLDLGWTQPGSSLVERGEGDSSRDRAVPAQQLCPALRNT